MIIFELIKSEFEITIKNLIILNLILYFKYNLNL